MVWRRWKEHESERYLHKGEAMFLLKVAVMVAEKLRRFLIIINVKNHDITWQFIQSKINKADILLSKEKRKYLNVH
jgi:hypothetical protein